MYRSHKLSKSILIKDAYPIVLLNTFSNIQRAKCSYIAFHITTVYCITAPNLLLEYEIFWIKNKQLSI